MSVNNVRSDSQNIYANKTDPIKNSGNNEDASIFFDNKTVDNSDGLREQFNEIKKEQGFIGKAWDGIKNALKIGLSSDDVEQSIKDYEAGKISLEEAYSKLESFEDKQKNTVNLVSNIASGVITAGVVAVTGGVGAIALGAAVGGAAKAGIKTADRATNEIKGDALDAKQIIKDGLTGAIDGAATTMTAGMIKGLNTASIAGKSMKSVVATGVAQGAKAGAITGAITGAGDYTVEAIMEKDVDFKADELLKTTAQTALFGGLAGGVMGGITNGVQYKKVYNQTMAELHETADQLAARYKEGIGSVRTDYEAKFGDLSTIDEGGLTARSKSNGTDSIFSKLKSKFDDGELVATDFKSCSKVIGDGYGIRIQLKDVPEQRAREIIMQQLGGGEEGYQSFIKALESGEKLSDDYMEVLTLLKHEQSEQVLQRMIDLIEDGQFALGSGEFNNYGTELTSYFSDDQLTRLSQAYARKTGQPLDLVNKTKFEAKVNIVGQNDAGEMTEQTIDSVRFGEKATKKADKVSGYTSTQGNAQSTTTTGEALADTELQIRGKRVHDFAEVEHVPYDIRKGKITASDSRYADIYGIIKGMSDDSYNAYNQYLKATYRYLRAGELGITLPEPSMPTGLSYASKSIFKKGAQLTQEEIKMLSKEGLHAMMAASH